MSLKPTIQTLTDEARWTPGAWLTHGVSLLWVTLSPVLYFLGYSYSTDGWTTTTPVTFILDDNLSGQPSPLRAGDEIIAINGQPLTRDTLVAIPIPRERQVGQIVRYTLIRDGQTLEVDVPLTQRSFAAYGPSLANNWEGWTSLALDMLSLLVVAFAFVRRPGNLAARYLLLIFSCFTAVAGFNSGSALYTYAFPTLLSFWYGVLGLAPFWFFFPSWILLLLTFPVRKRPMQRFPQALPLAFYGLPILFQWPGVWLEASGNTHWRWLEALGVAPIALMVAGTVVTFVGTLIHNWVTIREPIQRAQLRWLTLGLVGWGLGFAISIFAALSNQPWWDGLSWPLTLLFPVSLTIAILRYRLWDIDFVINRSLVYGALTVALGGVFTGMLWAVSQVAQGQAFIIAFGLTAVLGGAFFQPARRRLQRFVDQRFYHIEIDYQQTPAIHAPAPAQHAFGPYGGLELIGRGGMGEVYKAQHPTLNRAVALKLLPATLAAEGDFRQRFQREAKTLTALQHPHIVQVFESGELNGVAYMVMEYLAGQDLAAHLRVRGRLLLSEAMPILTAIARALDHAHAQGFVHRDIKPSNVMLESKPDSSTRAVLTDFGIAKILGGHTHMTQTGGMLGTFDYIAPEQIQGAADIDGRADVYAFGVMAYQMLTGELPFKHHNPGALLIAHLSQPAPDPREVAPDLPRSVAHALQQALAKAPAERYASAGEFVTALNS